MSELAPHRILRALLVGALALGGCDSCESGGPVPFGLDAGRTDIARDPRIGPTEPGAARSELVARELPEGTTRAEVEGATVTVTGESIRAIGAWDLDRDGDRDALLVTGGDATRGPRAVALMREGGAFGPPIELASSPVLAVGCTIERAGVRAGGESMAIAEAVASCRADDLGATRIQHVFAISAGPRPRAIERFVLRARLLDDGASDAIALRAEDRDDDALPDLVADVSLRLPGIDAPAEVSLAFLDRPAGLARDPGEPELRIAALAQEARGVLRRRPERARALASRALALWDAICRESGRARLEVGGAVGLSCGRSAGAGRALAVLAQAAARTGDPLVAIDAMQRLTSPAVTVRDAEREAARGALASLASTGETVHEGPTLSAPRARAPRLSVLAFLDENRLLIRGSPPRIVDLASGAETPADPSVHGTLALVDPSGHHRVSAIERRCDGTVLVIAPHVEVGSQQALSDLPGARATALVAPRRAPPGAPCPELTPALRADDDGWQALGWAPQGVLVARGTELRVVPLDVAGHPAGDPVVLEVDAVIPAPIAPGHATADARAFAHSVPGGLVLVQLTPTRRATFLRPAEHADAEGAPIDVAVSPSGRRLAWIAGGHVRWIERATPAP